MDIGFDTILRRLIDERTLSAAFVATREELLQDYLTPEERTWYLTHENNLPLHEWLFYNLLWSAFESPLDVGRIVIFQNHSPT
jgi:hypothetical protein